jgi:hypothetical protein
MIGEAVSIAHLGDYDVARKRKEKNAYIHFMWNLSGQRYLKTKAGYTHTATK